jgi:hypothetical protein
LLVLRLKIERDVNGKPPLNVNAGVPNTGR